jgi:Kef-type K+ transport system membrane component KefB/nucleotide-binding universal stress UspA family protein
MKAVNFPIDDNVLLFFALIFIILVAPMFSKRIKLPGIVGIIIAGVIVGPNGFNIIAMTPAIQLLGSVGLLYIMFLAGLDINLLDFKRHKEKSIVFGLITFAIPQFFGTFLFKMLGFSWTTSILVASMFASHTLVGYPIITKLGIVRNRAVLTTVGGTIIADTLALLVLAIIARSVDGVLDFEFWVTLIILSAIYVLVIVYLLPILGRLFFRFIDDSLLQFQFVLAVAFLFSFLARVIGIEPIVGAFLAGLVLNRLIPASSQLMNRVQFVGQSLFIPFFLLYIGMIVDVEILLTSSKSWFVMFTMLATNMLTKLVSSVITQKIFKFTKAEGWVIFGLTTTEAAATLAAALIGYRLGIIGDEILNGVVMMILITCIIGPMIVEKFGRKIAFSNEGSNFEKVVLPHLLVPVSNPQTANNLLSLGMILKGNTINEISALAVISDTNKLDEKIENAEKLLCDANEYANSQGVKLNMLKRIEVNVANGIVKAALEEKADMLILGWNGNLSAKQYVFGSILDQILELSNQSVLVCKIDKSIMSNSRIMVYITASTIKEPGFYNVFKSVISLASGMNAPIYLATEQQLIELIKTAVKNSKTEVEIFYEDLTEQTDQFGYFEKLLKKDDLVFSFGARKNAVNWMPYYDKLPAKIAARLKDNNFIIAYPGILFDDQALNHAANIIKPKEF